jgi:hypothetical protein
MCKAVSLFKLGDGVGLLPGEAPSTSDKLGDSVDPHRCEAPPSDDAVELASTQRTSITASPCDADMPACEAGPEGVTPGAARSAQARLAEPIYDAP